MASMPENVHPEHNRCRSPLLPQYEIFKNLS